MRAIAFLRRRWPEVAWAAFAIANFVAMGIWPGWETIPFHFVWISLTLLYGFRVWRRAATYLTLSAVVTVTGGMILKDGYIYCGHKHNNGLPICVELETGKTVWGGEERGPGSGS